MLGDTEAWEEEEEEPTRDTGAGGRGGRGEEPQHERSTSYGRNSREEGGRGGRGERGGRNLIAEALTVDWFTAGKTTGIKDQGSCGSCWAFTANTVSETTYAIKSGKAPVALSEQQLIDCTTNTTANNNMFGKTYKTYGCGGGWMAYGWDFQRDQGAFTDAQYPYTGRAQTCKHKELKDAGNATFGNIS